MELNLLFLIVGLNIITHIVLFIFNNLKSNGDSPTIFKLITYFGAFSINIIIFSAILFQTTNFEEIALLVYFIITFIIFLIHFIFDEDWLFRFEKSVILTLMLVLVIIFYVTLSFFMI